MINLASWTDEDLRAGLAAIADMRKAVASIAVAQAAWAIWNEALHPRDSNGEFSVSGTAHARSVVDTALVGKHDGMTQRSRATHIHIYHKLKEEGHVGFANSYLSAVNKARAAKVLIHPREALGKANMHLHTGDMAHLEATPKLPGVAKPTSVAKVPQFKIEHQFKVIEGSGKRLRDEGDYWLSHTSTSTDHAIVAKYTGDWYSHVNKDLRDGVLTAQERANVEKLDKALRETITSENHVVDRNVSATVLGKIRKAGVGGIFQDPAFGSTHMSGGGGGIQIEIPKGSPGLYVNSISKHKGEDEFLLPRESEFEILKVGGAEYHEQAQYRLRYIGSNKATHRPDVKASLTEVKVEIQQPAPVAASTLHPTHVPLKSDTPMQQISLGYESESPISDLKTHLGLTAKKIDGPHGSQPGQWYESSYVHGTYYVKPMSAERAANEVGANGVYKVLGAVGGEDVPNVWMQKDGEQYSVLSQKVEGLQSRPAAFWENEGNTLSSAISDKAAKFWAVDVLLSNWDAPGLAHDNLVLKSGDDGWTGVTRIDSGGAMKYRAQGALKDNWKVGGAWNEAWTMRGMKNPYGGTEVNKPGSQASAVFGHLTNAQAATKLANLRLKWESNHSAEALNAWWKVHGMSAKDRAENLAIIQSRIDQIPTIVGQLNQNPGQKAH